MDDNDLQHIFKVIFLILLFLLANGLLFRRKKSVIPKPPEQKPVPAPEPWPEKPGLLLGKKETTGNVPPNADQPRFETKARPNSCTPDRAQGKTSVERNSLWDDFSPNPQTPKREPKHPRETQRGRQKQEFKEERNRLISSPIPPEIEHAIRTFRAGNFVGEDRSPLAYVGYRVGKTHGLPKRQRQACLKVCLKITIPEELFPAYGSWGNGTTHRRYKSIDQHLTMLADMRRNQPKFEQAVSDWDGDKAWFRETYGEFAKKMSRYGF